MKLPLSLLKSFVDVSLSPAQIGETLTLLGIEVDAIEQENSSDPVFELSLTPNLGYCLSARGVARELSAFLNLPFKPAVKPLLFPKHASPFSVSIEKPDLCPRYIGLFFEEAHIGPSPSWLQDVLKAAGMRPINNGVDITNYILLKWGQPMHAFDADLIEGKNLRVVPSREEFSFLCLDGIEKKVPKETLLICDEKKPIALAGIMGGENSTVSEKTKTIFLEAAFFDPIAIRNASKKMGLRSESSLRFEKGIDPDAMIDALQEAAELFQMLCKAKISSEPLDYYLKPFSPKHIACRGERVQKILGQKISLHEIQEIFHRLGFKASLKEPDTLFVSVPPYRFDIQEEIDLIEEVARIYGYNAIEKKKPFYTTTSIGHDPVFLFERILRKKLNALELQEILTADLISPKLADLAIEAHLPGVQFLKVLHAKSEEYSILRPSLLPGFLQTVQYNVDQKNHSFAGFEVGHIYFEQNEKKIELPMVGIFLTGKSRPHHWDQKPSDFDFYDLKGLLENLFESLSISDISFKIAKHPSFHPGRQASIDLKDFPIGSLGEVHPNLLKALDIKQRVFYAELSLNPLIALEKKAAQMKPLPPFPSSERDWTVSLSKEGSVQPIFDAIQKFSSKLLEKAELIDRFVAETQNVTFRFTYRDPLKTISFEEVETEHARLMQNVLASLR